MEKYLTSKPVNSTKNSEKQKSTSVPTDNSSQITPLIPELTTEPSHLQSLTTESSYDKKNTFEAKYIYREREEIPYPKKQKMKSELQSTIDDKEIILNKFAIIHQNRQYMDD
ncbi:hypothetical protein TNCV_1106371 [Trichonephila clavipes]|nr:hypothetical protein TNCV_1106371 [Trichonephila clavipes]